MNFSKLLSVARKGTALQEIPENERTTELCKVALLNDGRALRYVPQNKLTRKICELAVEQDVSAIQHVPHNYRTKQLYIKGLQRSPDVLKHIPPEKMTTEMFQMVAHAPWVIRAYLSEHYEECLLNPRVSKWVKENKDNFKSRILASTKHEN